MSVSEHIPTWSISTVCLSCVLPDKNRPIVRRMFISCVWHIVCAIQTHRKWTRTHWHTHRQRESEREMSFIARVSLWHLYLYACVDLCLYGCHTQYSREKRAPQCRVYSINIYSELRAVRVCTTYIHTSESHIHLCVVSHPCVHVCMTNKHNHTSHI